MSKINTEIEEMATKLEKASVDPRETLFNVIKSLGPEGIKAKLAELNDEDKVVLKAALEEMNLQKAVSFDKEADSAKVIRNPITQTIIQEEIASDDADEKLMKPEAAAHNHQGGPVEGWEGQVIKSVNESDELTEKVVDALLTKGLTAEQVIEKCMKKGMDGKKVQGAVEKFKGKGKDEPKDGKEEMEKASKECEAEAKKEAKKEVKDHEEKMHVKKSEGEEEEPKKKDDGNKEAKKEAKKEAAAMKKSLTWEDDNRLFKANTGGRNHSFSMEAFIDANQEEPKTEEVKKSEGQKEDLNDLINKGGDKSWSQLQTEAQHAENASKVNGFMTKSFDDVKDVAALMGISEEEAKKIIG